MVPAATEMEPWAQVAAVRREWQSRLNPSLEDLVHLLQLPGREPACECLSGHLDTVGNIRLIVRKLTLRHRILISSNVAYGMVNCDQYPKATKQILNMSEFLWRRIVVTVCHETA